MNAKILLSFFTIFCFSLVDAQEEIYSVSVSSNNDLWGSVTGGGLYSAGDSVIIEAFASDGCRFMRWSDNVLANPRVVFVESNIVAIAVFEEVPYMQPENENGLLPGVFSVSECLQIRFSRGSLQYRSSTSTWRFAEHQYDFVGNDTAGNVSEGGVKCNNLLISSAYDGWIDLFGWATSGYHNENDTLNVNHYPYSTSCDVFTIDYECSPTENHICNTTCYGPHIQSNYTFFDIKETQNPNDKYYDWGVYVGDSIINGQSPQWRSLTFDELHYLLYERNDYSILKGIGDINGVRGCILLPDNWSCPSGLNFNSYSNSLNYYSAEQWVVMENAGAVFLPIVGFRNGVVWHNQSVFNYPIDCLFRTTQYSRLSYKPACCLGLPVRLVREN